MLILNNFTYKNVIFSIVFVLALNVSGKLFAQNKKPHARINAQRQVEYGLVLKKEEAGQLEYAHQLARKKGWQLKQTLRDGKIRTLVRVDDFGIPIYEESDNNSIAAETTNVNKLYTGGSLGLNLSGSTMPPGSVAVFESGGSPLTTHQEFAGRINLKTSSSVSTHATHVAGTIMAAGINPSAKGMAFALPELWSFIPSTTSMNNFSNVMLLSNHSYGVTSGWNKQDDGVWRFYGRYGDNEDYKFGYYDSSAERWDQICYNAPYYLPVKSSGNFRSRTGPAIGENYKGYDASGALTDLGPRPLGMSSNDGYGIISTYGNAKNILTVGAVYGITNQIKRAEDIRISSFSSWGPTDDGRIKPDLVADGVSVTSTGDASNTSYTSMSGTSMSTPNVTGTLTLLQELYYQKNGEFMRSATTKALAIATAAEAGTTPGPDYVYGWGLLDAEKAANTILNDKNLSLIQERSLFPGATESIRVVAKGQEPLVATICWTDPAATPVPTAIAMNNQSLRLVNDLDIRADDGINIFSPWILNPANPTASATRGDNFRDNVEQVFIDNPETGKIYTLSISHKNGLKDNSPQAYSIVVTGVNGNSYCVSNSTSNTGARIANMSFANLNISASQICDNYGDYTSNIAEIKEGQSYNLSIATSSCVESSTAIAKVFIDWNVDGDFDDTNELVATSPAIVINGSYNTTVTVPYHLMNDATTRMRIVLMETNDASNVQACGSYNKGTTHDYTVKLLSQTRLYVKKDANGLADGTSWTNAMPELGDALKYAETHSYINEIWVAKGVYYPITKLDPAGTDRDKTFILKEGVKLYGGFAGNEDISFDLTTRDFTTNETILSGDFNNDDVVTIDGDGVILEIANNSENAHHVVVSYNNTSATLLDGFTVKGGNANGAGTVTLEVNYDLNRNNGGGVFLRKSSATLSNLTVTNNHALASGAGIYLSTGRMIESPKSAEDITVSNSAIAYNWGSDVGTSFAGSIGAGMAIAGTSGYLYKVNLSALNFKGNWGGALGGALRVFANVNVEVNNSTFINNRSRHGGAVYVQSNPTTPLKITGSIFTKNFGGNGGAIEGNNATSLIIQNTDFVQNEATNGGGIYILGTATSNSTSELTITGSTFKENIASTAGGGIRLSQAVNMTVSSTIFEKNSASGASNSGGVDFLGTTNNPIVANLNNLVFKQNKGGQGGAVRISTNSAVTLRNTKFIENESSGTGGAVYSITATSSTNLVNALFVGNSAVTTGGAVTLDGCTATIVGCTFYENTAKTNGGGLRLTNTSSAANVYNSLFYNNIHDNLSPTTPDISDGGATLDIQNTLTQIYGLDGVNGVKVGATPLFLSLEKDHPLFLVPSGDIANPILNSGDNSLVPIDVMTDLTGVRNRKEGTVDMGAYEYSLVLPVSISSFSAKLVNNRTNLNWSVGTENNVSHYEVERSQNGLDFSNIATVKANASASYQTTDNSPSLGVNYYRLKTVDKDGSTAYFNKVQSVNVADLSATLIAVYPNPAGDIVKVSGLAQGNYSYKLVNTAGATVQQGTLNTDAGINVSGLKAGMYVLQLSNGTQLKVLKK